jgi:NTE family protein/lysophospholipid hydrolase
MGCAPVLVGRIEPGSLVGEIGLLMGGRRGATVTAAEPTRLGRLSAADVEAVLARYPETRREVLETARRRLRRTQWLKILAAYFGEIDADKLALIEPRFEWRHLDRGERLFAQGDEADGLYILIHGFLQAVASDAPGEERIIGSISRGEIVGEMAILSGDRRMATVRAVRDSDVVRLSKADFEQISRAYPAVSLAIMRILVKRLRDRGRVAHRPGAVNVALVPADPGVPLAETAERLRAALACADRTALVNSRSLAAELPALENIAQVEDDSPLYLGLATWLEDLESRHDYVLYECDAEATPWTRRCLGQADQVLVIGRAGDDPAPGPVERAWLARPDGAAAVPQTLILIHPDGEKLPSGTLAWLTPRRLEGHVHLRWDREEDFARLARIVSRRAVGLVLGGGGARGMAHLGVIKALRERGIPVDMVAGTSIGAIVGGAVAMGMDEDKLLRLCRETLQESNPFNDFTVPLVSLLRSGKINRAARRAYGDARIEDLWLGFFCMSSDLSACDVKAHSRGPLWIAARTSASLPGIMVPIVHDGAVHVDGGVMNNLPGDVMRGRAGIVIAVDVDSRENMRTDLGELPSAWKILWSRILPWKRRILAPNIAEILMAAIMTGSRKNADAVKDDADLSLEPPVHGIGILDFKAIDETARAGYEYTRGKLDALPADSPLRRLFRPA